MSHTTLKRHYFNVVYDKELDHFLVTYYTPEHLHKKEAYTETPQEYTHILRILKKDRMGVTWSQRDMAKLIKIASKHDPRHKRDYKKYPSYKPKQ